MFIVIELNIKIIFDVTVWTVQDIKIRLIYLIPRIK